MANRRRRASWIFAGLAAPLLLTGYWYTHRAQPADVDEVLFTGVEYRRRSLRIPRPIVFHAVIVDLEIARPSFATTPGDPNSSLPYKAMSVPEFLAANDLDLAINADFVKPFWSRAPWDYYPRRGNGVRTRGLSAHRGTVVTPADPKRPSFFVTQSGEPSFDSNEGPIFDAISGQALILKGGVCPLPDSDSSYWRTSLQPRMAVGLDRLRRKLVFIAVDGRQPGYSEGATARELASFGSKLGVDTLLDLDGGGAATLVVKGNGGSPRVLNCPIDLRIPGRVRPVGNHLGLRTRPTLPTAQRG